MSATPVPPEPSLAASDAIYRSCANQLVGASAPGPMTLNTAQARLAEAAEERGSE